MPLRFAVVTEGPGDFLVLSAAIKALLPGADVVPIHPEVPVAAWPEYARVKSSALGTGWRGVRAWWSPRWSCPWRAAPG